MLRRKIRTIIRAHDRMISNLHGRHPPLIPLRPRDGGKLLDFTEMRAPSIVEGDEDTSDAVDNVTTITSELDQVLFVSPVS